MRVLTLDIETAPNLAHVWGLWQQNVSLSQLIESGEVLCFAAKWHGEKKVMFWSVQHDGKIDMLEAAYNLVNEADVIVHFNGTSFDMPWLRSEWVRQGWTPPSKSHEIDLCTVAKRTFRFPSNKLDYLATALLGEGKVKHAGHTLWVQCMAGDPAAWRTMEKYNRADVVLTERLYDRLRPWIKDMPHPALYDGKDPDCCPECGSNNLERRGYAFTKLSRYQRFQCRDCQRWCRGGKRLSGVETR